MKIQKNDQSSTEARLLKLKSQLAASKRRPILFVGSGISQRYVNMPNWNQLIQELFDRIKTPHPFEYYMQREKQDLIKVAEKLVNFYSNYYWKEKVKKQSPKELYASGNPKDVFLKYEISKIILEHFEQFDSGKSVYREELQALRGITPQLFITTNYDNFLENQFPKYTPIISSEGIIAGEQSDSFSILKIHGSVEQYKSIVIDKNDYDTFNENQLYIVSKLITYLVDYPVIFIGYSANDPDIRRVLSSVKKIQKKNSSSPVMQNMWFIDWAGKISETELQPDVKYLALDGTESIGVNYLKLTSFTELFEVLHQETVDVDALKTLQHTIYQIVKSSSITKLDIDVANIDYLKNPDEFLQLLTKKDVFLNLAQMADPDQLAATFVLTPTQLAKAVFGSEGNWQMVNRFIDEVATQIGLNIRKNNNPYHVNLSGTSRYSTAAVDLLKTLRDGKTVVLDPTSTVTPFHMAE